MRQKDSPFSFGAPPFAEIEADISPSLSKSTPSSDRSYRHAELSSAPYRAKPEAFEIKIELTRKLLHLLIAFAPILLLFSRTFTLAALFSGTLSYILFETLRRRGIRVPVVSWLTERAARIRDDGHFVWGPVTLGVGAFLATLLFEQVEATIAIYALAFGDGFSSLIGKAFGRIPMPLSGGKSVEGSLTCISLTFLSTYLVTHSFGVSFLVAAITSTVELLPLKDLDNIAIPLAAGFAASLLL